MGVLWIWLEVLLIAGTSSGSSWEVDLLSSGDLSDVLGRADPAAVLVLLLRHVLPHRREVERSGQAQGPGERPPLVGEVEATGVGMHAGTSPRQAVRGIGGEHTPDRHDAQQGGSARALPAAHTRAHRSRRQDRGRV